MRLQNINYSYKTGEIVYNRSMTKKTKKYLLILIILYVVIGKIFSVSYANIFLILAFSLMLLRFLYIKFKIARLKYNYISTVPEKLVYNSHTLINDYCIARFFPDEKIVVIDNPKSREHSLLRTFIIDKKFFPDLLDTWNDICSFFNDYTYLDALFLFVDKSNKILNIKFLDRTDSDFEIEGMSDFITKADTPKTPPVKKVENQPKIKAGGIVDFSDLKKTEIKLNTSEENTSEIVNLKDLIHGEKIYINYDNAYSISVLPGINIVKAKKIVEYRNINGLFKTKQDFIQIADAKEHFTQKILDMISLDKPDKEENKNNINSERTVD